MSDRFLGAPVTHQFTSLAVLVILRAPVAF